MKETPSPLTVVGEHHNLSGKTPLFTEGPSGNTKTTLTLRSANKESLFKMGVGTTQKTSPAESARLPGAPRKPLGEIQPLADL